MFPNEARWRCMLNSAVVLPALLLGAAASATDYSLTGFGTAGYAVSDMRSPYLRYIDKNGTTRADSLIGLQAEAQFDPQWGATLQVVTSAPRYKDEGVATQVRWAFVSLRPSNEWLFRAGRLRPPVLINTQNAEVGLTFDQARLPVEVYSLSPVYDIDGAAVTQTMSTQTSELSVDAYWGNANIKFRNPYQPNRVSSIFPDSYIPEKIRLAGLVLSHASGHLLLRGGVHIARIKADGGQSPIEGFAQVPIPAPFPVGGTLYVPGQTIPKVDVNAWTIGANWQLGRWRIVGEYGQRFITDTTIGVGSKSAYVLVANTIGRWTPYLSYARLLSEPETRKIYRDLNATPVPLAVQGPPLSLPASFHRLLASGVFVYDQHSIMLGTSYNISLNSKLKFEWMRTKVGLASVLVDGDVHNKSFNVLSMSYNFAF